MVDVPTNVQQMLVCSKCGKLLQRGPVYLQHDGAAVCGLCQISENVQPVVRCLIYEAVAQLLWFPCRYQEKGCPATVSFVAADSTEFNHEDACEYRQYKCPMLNSNPCKWEGPRNDLQQHCLEEHPDCVLPNPAVITPDIHRSQLTNYIIPAFGLPFLLHSRVCESTFKLQYAVRLLAAPQLALNYSYALTIQRGETTHTKTRDVLPQELLVLEEHSALNLNTNDLVSMLNGWDGVSLSVEVKFSKTQVEQKRAPKRRRVVQREKPVAICPPRNFMCLNEGCSFQEIGEKKRDKHSKWFCARRIRCSVCKVGVPFNTQWQDHYTTCMQVIQADSYFLVFWRNDWQYFLVETAIGRVVCDCKFTEDNFIFFVRTPVPCEQLYLYRCEVRLKSADNIRIYTPGTLYEQRRDWQVICEDMYEDEGLNFFTNNGIHVCLQVNKIE